MEPRNIAVVASEPMASKYQESGFPVQGFNLMLMTFSRSGKNPQKPASNDPHLTLKSVDESLYKDVLEYHNSVVKLSEREFQDVFLPLSSYVVAAVKNGTVVGCGGLQKMGRDFRLCPLLSETTEIAQYLLESLLGQIPKYSKVVIPVPEANRDLIEKMMNQNAFSMESEEVIKRFYSKRKVELDFDKIFAPWNLDSMYPPKC